MLRRNFIRERVGLVATALKPLSDEFVFVGGSIVPFLVTDPAAHDARPTKDVDVVIEVASRSEYQALSERLAKVGFHLDMMDEVMCRFTNGELVLDVMPTNEEILKFGNRWHQQAFYNPLTFSVGKNIDIKVLNAPLFVCTKIDAYGRRKSTDEKDLEDIIAVINGRKELHSEVKASPNDVRQYIASELSNIVDFNRLDWYVQMDAGGKSRLELLEERIRAFFELT